MSHPGWVLVIVGVLIAVIGVAWMLAPSTPTIRFLALVSIRWV
jgi:hypothetical protein